jgi:hypothetical protein
MAEETLAAQILSDSKDNPDILHEEQTPTDESKPKVTDETPEVTEETKTPETVETEETTEKPEVKAETKPSVEDQIKALSDQLKDLQAKLSQPEKPVQPTIDPDNDDLLANVYDEQGFQRAEKDLEELVRFAETHRDGAYDYEVKDAKGNVTKRDYTPEQITNIKLRAEAALRAIPKRREYVALRARCDARAVEVYPDLAKEDSNWRKDAAQMLAAVPQLAQIPDFMIWIGHALRGRDEFLKEQAGKSNGHSTAVDRIKAAPKEVAPATASTRGTIPHTEAKKKEAALNRLKTERSEDAAEEYLATLGF